ncbi:MAG: M50 family metallopeptidase [Candidatus Shapirobacteria bacterium]
MDILIFIIALSVLVLVHEFGHFFAAKITGVRVEEFGLGLPPKIVSKKKWGTVWSLNWLPIGGFCKLYGEDVAANEISNNKDSFLSKNPWQKALIVLGGVLMNLVLAIVIFTSVYSILGIPVETERVSIIGVADNSPAQEAGLKVDDIVARVEEREIKKGSELTEEIAKYKGKEVNLLVKRKGQEQELSVQVKVREKAPDGQGLMGVVISNTEMQKIKWYQFYKGIGAGFKEAYYWGKIIGGGVYQMIVGLFTGNVPKDVTGPIGMYKATSSIRNDQGLLAMIHFFGVVSVNLAIVNVLPFPALDGGRIVFVFYELLTKKRANEKFEIIVNNIGMMILLGLILLVTIGDIMRLFQR